MAKVLQYTKMSVAVAFCAGVLVGVTLAMLRPAEAHSGNVPHGGIILMDGSYCPSGYHSVDPISKRFLVAGTSLDSYGAFAETEDASSTYGGTEYVEAGYDDDGSGHYHKLDLAYKAVKLCKRS